MRSEKLKALTDEAYELELKLRKWGDMETAIKKDRKRARRLISILVAVGVPVEDEVLKAAKLNRKRAALKVLRA